jgi:hypothetical protein
VRKSIFTLLGRIRGVGLWVPRISSLVFLDVDASISRLTRAREYQITPTLARECGCDRARRELNSLWCRRRKAPDGARGPVAVADGRGTADVDAAWQQTVPPLYAAIG